MTSPTRRVRLRAYFAAGLPLRILRVLAYRLLLGYRMPLGTRIGLFSVVDVASVKLGRGIVLGRSLRLSGIGRLEIGDGVRIASRTRIIRVGAVRIGDRTSIGGDNVIQAPSWGEDRGDLKIGEDVVITAMHFLDLTENVTFGDRSTLGGIRSSLWTHGGRRGVGHAPIRIGRNCYIGSDVKFAAGVTLPDDTVVGLGSVVIRGPEEPGRFVAGAPARVIGPASGAS